MSIPPKNKKRIVFLYSDTGGGHRSAAEAIIEALELEFPGYFDCVMVDFFEDYSPPPFNMAGPIYPVMSRMDHLWKFSFDVSDDPDRMRVIYSMFWPYIRLYLYRLIKKHPCDLFVSVHPLINIPLLRAMRRRNIRNPYIIVVTDLVSTHTAWFTNDATRVIVPTEQAIKKALQALIQPAKLKVIGLPVAERFRKAKENKEELRLELGWSQEKLTVLLVGGGEGMGP
jgi:1,2-diacylglycerol 3-beta-galactosyltransferase